MAKKKELNVQEEVAKRYPEFIDAIQGMSVIDLEKRLTSYAKERVKTKEAEDADEKLQKIIANSKEIAEMKKELQAPYKDAIEAIGLKSAYLVGLIREKGGQV